jgi:hypothetical protein
MTSKYGPQFSTIASAAGAAALRAGSNRLVKKFKINYFAEICSGSEGGSYSMLIDFFITLL